jgi:hypothetical protein
LNSFLRGRQFSATINQISKGAGKGMAIFEYGEYQNTYESPDNLVEIFENSVSKYANNLFGEGRYPVITISSGLRLSPE